MKTPEYKPIILNELQTLKYKKSKHFVDLLEEQSRELFLVRNPSFRFRTEIQKSIKTKGVWVYYPWRNTIVHILAKSDFFELRTARNRNLITKDEQIKIAKTRVGISGLSVGNSIAITLAMEGFNNFCLADFDELSVSNLNRLRTSLIDLGINKAVIAARQIYEINPYADINVMTQGIRSESDLKYFMKDLDLIIDETDDVKMRLEIRKLSKIKKLPVVSAADNGFNAVVDIERFDLDPKRAIYHGKLKSFDIDNVGSMDFLERFKLINAMVGVDLVGSRMKESLLEVGKTLYSWPQLGGAAMLSASSLAYIVKMIVMGKKGIKSGKYDVNLERIFLKGYDTNSNKVKRAKETQRFLRLQSNLFKK